MAPPPPSRTPRDFALLSLKGFCMGAADVIPGVSGGTIAFITGIYDELLKSVRSFDLRFLRLLVSFRVREALGATGWKFLLALVIGILVAVLSLAKLLAHLLQHHPVLIWSFFFGLILASAVVIACHMEEWKPSLIAWIVLGAAGAYALVGMVPVTTPNAPWFLLLSGAVAICAMILPGISGSFILVLLGKYHYVLEALNSRDFVTLILVGLGALIGLTTFARLLNWLLGRFRYETLAVLTGFMIGSLRKVWPWKTTLESLMDPHGKTLILSQSNVLPHQWSGEVMAALCLALLGLVLVLFLNRLAGPDGLSAK